VGRYSKGGSAPSPQTEEEALRIARATQSPSQTKEQTRLIAQGIQKGIDLYKRQQKAKARELDRQRKQQTKRHLSDDTAPSDDAANESPEQPSTGARLPWILLALSWAGFIAYLSLSHSA